MKKLLICVLSLFGFHILSGFLFGSDSAGNLEDKNASLIALYDGKSLKNWQKTDYAGKGEVFVNKNGNLVLEMGAELSEFTGKETSSQIKL